MASADNEKRPNGRNILLMGTASMVNDASSEMIAPILPMLLTSMGANGMVIGMLGGIRDSLSSLFSMYFGKMSDKAGKRKPFIISGYLITGIFKVALFFSANWIAALASASLERMSKAVRNAPRDALISESVPREKLARGFGLHRMMDTMGAVIGSVLVLLLVYFLKLDFGTIILAAACISFISVIPLFLLREGPMTTKAGGNGNHLQDERLKKLILIMCVFAVGNISYMFLILRAQQYFSPELAVVGPIALYILFNVAYAALAVPFGMFADRFGKKRTLDIGYGLMFLTMAGFFLAGSLEAFALLFILYGAAFSIIETEQSAVVSSMSEEGERGAALGRYYTGIGISKLVGSSAAGFMWMVGPSYTFLYSSVMTAAGAAMLFGFTHPSKKVRGDRHAGHNKGAGGNQ